MKKIINFSSVFIWFLFFSCINEKKIKNTEQIINKIESENCVFSVNLKTAQVIWSGYKTTDKIKVTGKFEKFKSAKIQKNNQYKSIQDLVEGLDFAVDLGSSFSGDQIRDMNLKDFFFNLLARNLIVTGKFEKLEGDSINVLLKLFGQEKQFKLGAFYENEMLHVKGTVDIIKQLEAKKAFESISNKCYDLHKGPDGVSKTWGDVELYIKTPIIKKCN